MRISDWSSDVCSSDLDFANVDLGVEVGREMLAVIAAVAIEDVERVDALDMMLLEPGGEEDRKSVVQGKSESVRVDLGGRSIIKKTIWYRITIITIFS